MQISTHDFPEGKAAPIPELKRFQHWPWQKARQLAELAADPLKALTKLKEPAHHFHQMSYTEAIALPFLNIFMALIANKCVPQKEKRRAEARRFL